MTKIAWRSLERPRKDPEKTLKRPWEDPGKTLKNIIKLPLGYPTQPQMLVHTHIKPSKHERISWSAHLHPHNILFPPTRLPNSYPTQTVSSLHGQSTKNRGEPNINSPPPSKQSLSLIFHAFCHSQISLASVPKFAASSTPTASCNPPMKSSLCQESSNMITPRVLLTIGMPIPFNEVSSMVATNPVSPPQMHPSSSPAAT